MLRQIMQHRLSQRAGFLQRSAHRYGLAQCMRSLMGKDGPIISEGNDRAAHFSG
jgi:hypothetical protein